jgi:diaminohydroxyphosphoribosylaminopyrimidine deaminase/5-amino-6-(5-phosphoribosylamino)uracil reductase
MQRCLQLAMLGAGAVAPNPMVGAVLVHEGRIIGEGYHQQYGEAHAEVNCINNVLPGDKHLIPLSTLYVCLEPCAHHGKTPPCTDLVIASKIKKVVIGCADPYKEVNRKGIEKLKAAGIEVVEDILTEECRELNKRFFSFHQKQRPWMLLKWAQTASGKISGKEGSALKISNDYTNRLVHRWRTEEAGILVGTNTALVDNPSLTARLWTGKNPHRFVVDMNDRLPKTLKLFKDGLQTTVFNASKNESSGPVSFVKINKERFIPDICNALFEMKIQSIMVEGGAVLLQHFINSGTWDEARIITSTNVFTAEGMAAPVLKAATLSAKMQVSTDNISSFINNNHAPE